MISAANKKILDRVHYLLNKGDGVMETLYDPHGSPRVDQSYQLAFASDVLHLIQDIYGKDSSYYSTFKGIGFGNYKSSCETGINILHSIREQIENGWLVSFKDLVSAEIFTDFMDMAEYLLNEGYKDPSAVVIGSVFESHLRKLCLKNSIGMELTKSNGDKILKKADILNAGLCKAGVYNSLRQKSITAWLDLRNKAAHGKYDEYTKEDVRIMYSGVLGFLGSVE